MRPVKYSADTLQHELEKHTVCTLEQLAKALGTSARMTLFRKLAELPYLTSYSHRGKYYALRASCLFDRGGLWSHKGIWFSKFGSLVETAKHYVDVAPAGYSTAELNDALHVETRQTLLQLVNLDAIDRQRISGTLVYFSADSERHQIQLKARGKIAQVHTGGVSEVVLEHEVKAAALLFFSLLDERQRRLFAGLESLKMGKGGDARISAIFQMDPHTVAKGRVELLEGDIDPERIRKSGGGRKSTMQKESGIADRIYAILRDDVAGDPMDGTRWTRRTTRSISNTLIECGINVSANTVRKLLGDMGFSLRTNRKNIESGVRRKRGDRAKRDRQFGVIANYRRSFEKAVLPVISFDGKKKEQVGNFKNTGMTWRDKDRNVYDHDFATDGIGVAIPNGCYDGARNAGRVMVGTSKSTPEFAVDTIVDWWRAEGRRHYPGADKLLILVDAGGANGPRCKVWKCDIQTKLCNAYGLTVTVCHYPPGASKWNPIEHRLWSEISRNWRGIPLETYEVVMKYIASTATQTGLRVSAVLNRKEYETGKTVGDQEMSLLNIRRHRALPDWNYTISPYTARQLARM